jgi:hypothetical protein
LTRGEYVGWLAIPTHRPDIIAGGAGLNSARFCHTRSCA